MKKVFVFIMLSLLCLLVIGCPPKRIVKPETQQPAYTPKETAKETAQKPSEVTPVKPEEKITEQQLAKIESKEEPIKYIEERDRFEDIHFDYDKYDLRPDAKPVLEEVSSWLLKNKSAKILVEGHCDSRGTNEYNLALGDRRAKAVRDYFIALGIAPDRIEMLSYGEEKPICTEETEECWAKNRRAHLVVLREANK
jgi:peptidoglycan-associated lipoprotein